MREFEVELPEHGGLRALSYSPGRKTASLSVAKKLGASAAVAFMMWTSRESARNGRVVINGVINGVVYEGEPENPRGPGLRTAIAKGGITGALISGDIETIFRRAEEGYCDGNNRLLIAGPVREDDIVDRYELP
ncbi:hypothetical protein [Saccharothrix xinjiangensis]|uniref:Uncharacterized protein n=1 Tax=Saccharothrix xinjiangensis TaxID=204798 RepID=A0ABV9Y4M5_9PSEU